jgi:hypothetical protein
MLSLQFSRASLGLRNRYQYFSLKSEPTLLRAPRHMIEPRSHVLHAEVRI